MATARKTFAAALVGVLATLPLSAQTAKENKGSKELEVTLIGCVELEKDYRARMDAGRGGLLGSGLGVENEFVLTDAKPVPGTTKNRSRGVVGTSGTSGDYSLTGKLESGLNRAIGRQVQIVGVVEPIAAHHSAEDTKNLPRLKITVWHPVADYCPAK